MIATLLAVASLAGGWSGTYTVPAGTQPMSVRLEVHGSTGVAALGLGLAGRIGIRVSVEGGRVRFTLPGRPQPVAFDGTVTGNRLAGSVRQGSLRGSFALRRGATGTPAFTGVYRLADGSPLAIFAPRDQLLATNLATGEIHGLLRRVGDFYDVAGGLVTRTPLAGAARLGSNTIVYRGVAGRRIPMLYYQVRFRSQDGTPLAGTLTVPEGSGPLPAVALVHGSGTATRDDEALWASFFSANGFVVLAYDKRGIAESGGRFPGELATQSSVDTLARDAEAAASFLATQPEVDRSRLGLAGASQAGWILPLAADHEPLVRWLLLAAGPTVTTDEQQTWQNAAGGDATNSTTLANAEQEVEAGPHGGFDPLPSIRQLTIPAQWLFARNDRSVPTDLCIARLEPLTHGSKLSYAVFAGGSHSFLETANGFDDEVLGSHQLVSGFFSRVHDWLAAQSILPG